MGVLKLVFDVLCSAEGGSTGWLEGVLKLVFDVLRSAVGAENKSRGGDRLLDKAVEKCKLFLSQPEWGSKTSLKKKCVFDPLRSAVGAENKSEKKMRFRPPLIFSSKTCFGYLFDGPTRGG